ncbi:MAG TPA: bifunctional 4-hydroxy-2-oxoglutarate aldolase/2-dehydro-3-deoxy-phosphogluconate aldolase [Chloroflexota bacterium]|nr:bifunctional 4-hydroxy-2-oxoglutarate aldolase/2-dehydro-3-deoxy-phosphogluconate aldolase [Chloroflexota bacterium]
MTDARPAIPARLEQGRIVAILRRTEPRAAVATAEALAAGGIPALEVTCDSPGAVEMIGAIGRALGERVFVGAGTVLDADTAQAALDAGARFLVSPHVDADLVSAFATRGVAWIPGAFTATEVLRAWRAGAVVVKLFPAGSVGPGYIKDLLGPLRDIPLLPTGGVTLDNAASFLQAGAWGLGLGSALVSPQLVASGRFDELQERARQLVETVERARPTTTRTR